MKLIAATVLGVFAAPIAAVIPLIDPGTKDEGDGCAAAFKARQQQIESTDVKATVVPVPPAARSAPMPKGTNTSPANARSR